MTGVGQHFVDERTASWLEAEAVTLDTTPSGAAPVLPALTRAGLARVGVPQSLGGTGGDITDAVLAVAEVSALSLAAGFVLWGHRTYIEYLLQSPNAPLRETELPQLLDGTLAGATGLSNAMKFLAGLEDLQIAARVAGERVALDGKMPWVTNLRPQGFRVAAAASSDQGPMIVSVSGSDEGVVRSPDLDLMALRSTNTAALTLTGVEILRGRVLHADANRWLPQVRPAFLALQCGMSVGLARRALQEARTAVGAGRSILREPLDDATAALERQQNALLQGLRQNTFHADPAALFRLRIALADTVSEAVSLELQALGGRAYLNGPGQSFARRWREAAFIPLITPSLVQLKASLAVHQRSAA